MFHDLENLPALGLMGYNTMDINTAGSYPEKVRLSPLTGHIRFDHNSIVQQREEENEY